MTILCFSANARVKTLFRYLPVELGCRTTRSSPCLDETRFVLCHGVRHLDPPTLVHKVISGKKCSRIATLNSRTPCGRKTLALSRGKPPIIVIGKYALMYIRRTGVLESYRSWISRNWLVLFLSCSILASNLHCDTRILFFPRLFLRSLIPHILCSVYTITSPTYELDCIQFFSIVLFCLFPGLLSRRESPLLHHGQHLT
jgi:hypothetical protein